MAWKDHAQQSVYPALTPETAAVGVFWDVQGARRPMEADDPVRAFLRNDAAFHRTGARRSGGGAEDAAPSLVIIGHRRRLSLNSPSVALEVANGDFWRPPLGSTGRGRFPDPISVSSGQSFAMAAYVRASIGGARRPRGLRRVRNEEPVALGGAVRDLAHGRQRIAALGVSQHRRQGQQEEPQTTQGAQLGLAGHGRNRNRWRTSGMPDGRALSFTPKLSAASLTR